MATDICNSHCKTCNIWTNKGDLNPLTPGEISIALSDPICSDIDEVLITGGEPTLREDLFEFVMAIHHALPNANITLSTNGIRAYTMLITVRRLLENGVTKLSVGTSIDYIGDKHNEIRGVPDNWRKVGILIRGLQKLREEFPTLGICFGTVLIEENADNIDEIIKFANNNDLYYLIQWCNHSSFYHNKKMSVEKELDIVSKLPQDMLTEKWIRKLQYKPINFNCFAMRDFFVIKANGDICPCLTHWDKIYGNIRTTPISKYLGGSPACVYLCDGCLNSWAIQWSSMANGWPYVRYYIHRPMDLLRKLQ
jgi:MoaA/NifB/PqqE/SkfB family radical SAM enzyme